MSAHKANLVAVAISLVTLYVVFDATCGRIMRDESLYGAAGAGNLPEVKRLIAVGANVDAQFDGGSDTPLMIAAEAGNTEIVAYLLQKGADPNFAHGYKTALDIAKKPEIIRLLLRYGAK